MTKAVLRLNLASGKTMDELFHYTAGQECLIYKAAAFTAGDEIIYIPDIVFNDIPMDRPPASEEELEEVLSQCYTGNDFLSECEGDVDLARRLFSYCDWQHPSSALPEIDDGEDNCAADDMELGKMRIKISPRSMHGPVQRHLLAEHYFARLIGIGIVAIIVLGGVYLIAR